MERTISVEDKIKRAEEIYYKRNKDRENSEVCKLSFTNAVNLLYLTD